MRMPPRAGGIETLISKFCGENRRRTASLNNACLSYNRNKVRALNKTGANWYHNSIQRYFPYSINPSDSINFDDDQRRLCSSFFFRINYRIFILVALQISVFESPYLNPVKQERMLMHRKRCQHLMRFRYSSKQEGTRQRH